MAEINVTPEDSVSTRVVPELNWLLLPTMIVYVISSPTTAGLGDTNFNTKKSTPVGSTSSGGSGIIGRTVVACGEILFEDIGSYSIPAT